MNWGFELGFRAGDLTPAQVAQKLAALGYRWLVLEFNDYNNAARCAAVKAACAAHDLLFGIWLTRPFNSSQVAAAIQSSDAEFVALEGEIPAGLPQSVDWVAMVQELAAFDIPKAVVSNTAAFTDSQGNYQPDVAKPLVEDGWAYLSECYLYEQPRATPDNENWTVTTHLGWAETQPVIGLQGGRTFADYPTVQSYRGWSVWAAEYVL